MFWSFERMYDFELLTIKACKIRVCNNSTQSLKGHKSVNVN